MGPYMTPALPQPGSLPGSLPDSLPDSLIAPPGTKNPQPGVTPAGRRCFMI